MIDDVRHIEQLLTEKIAGRRILVLGDLMLDRYLWGTVDRISPEAPIPVVKLESRSESPGGAANVAANLAGLGVKVSLAGLCGSDQAGERLIDRFEVICWTLCPSKSTAWISLFPVCLETKAIWVSKIPFSPVT